MIDEHMHTLSKVRMCERYDGVEKKCFTNPSGLYYYTHTHV